VDERFSLVCRRWWRPYYTGNVLLSCATVEIMLSVMIDAVRGWLSGNMLLILGFWCGDAKWRRSVEWWPCGVAGVMDMYMSWIGMGSRYFRYLDTTVTSKVSVSIDTSTNEVDTFSIVWNFWQYSNIFLWKWSYGRTLSL